LFPLLLTERSWVGAGGQSTAPDRRAKVAAGRGLSRRRGPADSAAAAAGKDPLKEVSAGGFARATKRQQDEELTEIEVRAGPAHSHAWPHT
jgi:hypothetical protein